MLKADPENPRFVVEPSPEAIETFMGPSSVIDPSILVHPSMPEIFEPKRQDNIFSGFRIRICVGLKSGNA